MALTEAQARNIQGIGIAGFRKDHQQLIFVRIEDTTKAIPLLSELAHRTANAWEVRRFNELFSEIRRRGHEDEGSVRATWIGTLLSASGCRKLGLNPDELPAGEGAEAFKAGMAARAGQIGDTREKDAPTQWLPDFRPEAGGIDLLVVVASDDPQQLDHYCAELENQISASGCISVFSERGETLTGNLRGHEYFGFKDGVSQPAIEDWDALPAESEPAAVPLGEFVLGYPDATGNAVAVPELWLDGSFAVFRRLRQDVSGFRAQAAAGVPGSDPTLSSQQTAAKMVGRWPSGAPLELSPDSDSHKISNAFQYHAAGDDDGSKTPRFSHIRKANPRDELRVDLEAEPTARHRMLRRGAPYGPPLHGHADDGVDRGLHFLALVSDIARQFEFNQARWLNDPNFPNGGQPGSPGGPYAPPVAGEPPDGPDPIAGEFEANSQDALRQPSGVHTFPLMHELVTLTAGEYFFAPAIKTLRKLAESGTASTVAAAEASAGSTAVATS